MTVALRETLTFEPRFIEGSYDPVARTVSVIICSQGLGNARDKHYYGAATLTEAVKNKVFEGAQAYADHPSKFDDTNRPERSIRDLIGYYFNVIMTETLDKKSGKNVPAIGAKFKIQEGVDWVEGLIRESISYAVKFPNQCYSGISINADGDAEPTVVNGQTIKNVTKISEVFSADVVTKPARGGGFLKFVEGVHGTPYLNRETHVTTKDILEAAGQIEKLAEGVAVDPKDLLAIATGLREAEKDKPQANGANEKKDTDGDDELDEVQKAERNLETAKKNAAAKDVATGGTGKTNRESVSGAKPGDAGGTAGATSATVTKEAIAALTPSQLRESFPSLYAAALSQVEQLAEGERAAERSELTTLRTEKIMRESHDLAKRKLTESRIPIGQQQRLLIECLGKSETEMDAIIAGHKSLLESIGFNVETGKLVEGAGPRTDGRLSLRESDVTANTSALTAGCGVN
jgi:hypothetical protein